MPPLFLLFLSLFISVLGLSILFPVLPPLAREIGLSELGVGGLSAAYAVAQFVSSPFWGRLSEKGRKKPILIGSFGFSFGFLAFSLLIEAAYLGWLSGIPLLLALLLVRFLGGGLAAASLPAAQAYAADLTSREKRASGMAVIGAGFALGLVFGPVIGGFLAGYGLMVPLYFSVAIGLVNGVFVWLFLPDSQPAPRTVQTPKLSPHDRRIFPLLLLALALSVAGVVVNQTIAFYFQDRLGLSGAETARTVGVGLLVYGLAAAALQGWMIRGTRIAPDLLLRLGLPIYLIGVVLLIPAHSFTFLVVALALQGIGQGVLGPGLMALLSLSVSEQEQGALAGLNNSAQALGRMLGPLLGTGLYSLSSSATYGLSALILVLVWLVMVLGGNKFRPKVS